MAKPRRVLSTKGKPNVDLRAAKQFLRWLDPNAEAFSFQTWDDDRDRNNSRLTRLLHGSLDEHAEELVNLNRRGAAVAVTMNETDLAGARRRNIVRVRALFLDLDGASLDPVRDCPLTPHRIVETSPGKFHVYWLVERGDGVVLREFEDVQRAAAAR